MAAVTLFFECFTGPVRPCPDKISIKGQIQEAGIYFV